MKEADIQRKIVRGVNKLGWLAVKFTSPGNNGFPDLIVYGPRGRVIQVEVKTDVGKLSTIQKYQIGRLRRLGHDVRVVYGAKAADDFIQEVAGYAVHTARLSTPGD